MTVLSLTLTEKLPSALCVAHAEARRQASGLIGRDRQGGSVVVERLLPFAGKFGRLVGQGDERLALIR